MSTKRQKITVRFMAVIGMAVLSAWIAAKVILYSDNMLLHHPRWVSGKVLLADPIIGGQSGVDTRNLLARNRLNLDSWFGFNEILLAQRFDFGEVRFTFSLGNDGILDFNFNKDVTGFTGVRFSRNSDLPSITYHADASGHFVEKNDLALHTILPGSHAATITRKDNRYLLTVDDKPIQEIVCENKPEQLIGFRSQRRPVIVDNVRARDNQERVILEEEDFENDERQLLLAGMLLCFLLVVSFLYLKWPYPRSSFSHPIRFRRVCWVHYFSIVFLLSYFCVDYFYWSAQYPYQVHTPSRRVKSLPTMFLETKRLEVVSLFRSFSAPPRLSRESHQRVFEFLARKRSSRGDLAQLFASENEERIQFVKLEDSKTTVMLNSDESYKVVFLGTSQTWGSGANVPSDRIAPQITMAIAHKLKKPVLSVNLSVRGSTSGPQVERYTRFLRATKPDLVIANFGHNDADPDTLAKSLARLVLMNQARKIQTVFCLEPNTIQFIEQEHDELMSLHAAMTRVANTYDVPLIDFSAHMNKVERQGQDILWWDKVHMTSAGQRLAGEFIAAEIFRKGVVPQASIEGPSG